MPSRAPALRLLRLKVPTDLEPIEARLVDALPRDDGWQFEPKSPARGAVAPSRIRIVKTMEKRRGSPH